MQVSLFSPLPLSLTFKCLNKKWFLDVYILPLYIKTFNVFSVFKLTLIVTLWIHSVHWLYLIIFNQDISAWDQSQVRLSVPHLSFVISEHTNLSALLLPWSMASRFSCLEVDIKWKQVLTVQLKALTSHFFSDPQPFAIFPLKLNAYIVNLLCKVIKNWYEVCEKFLRKKRLCPFHPSPPVAEDHFSLLLLSNIVLSQ